MGSNHVLPALQGCYLAGVGDQGKTKSVSATFFYPIGEVSLLPGFGTLNLLGVQVASCERLQPQRSEAL